MKFLKLSAVIICCLSLCSCWDSIPIEDCAHPVIGAYDVPEDGKPGVTVTGIYYQSLGRAGKCGNNKPYRKQRGGDETEKGGL